MQPQCPADVPHHVAIIMDGNGRWAERRGFERSAGHRAGMETVREIVRVASELGVGWLTLYAFSSENWSRPKNEIDVLMSLPEKYFARELPEAERRGLRILTIGHLERLPRRVRFALERAVTRTASNTGMRLVFALSYGGRAEIVDATRRLLRVQEQGGLEPEALDEKMFAAHLDAPEMPDVDLLIRTGEEQRVSNFLLWQIAYAELVTADRMWPEFRRSDLEAAFDEYARRERRFGRTSAQAQNP